MIENGKWEHTIACLVIPVLVMCLGCRLRITQVFREHVLSFVRWAVSRMKSKGGERTNMVPDKHFALVAAR
jgi:hypothetical protein